MREPGQTKAGKNRAAPTFSPPGLCDETLQEEPALALRSIPFATSASPSLLFASPSLLFARPTLLNASPSLLLQALRSFLQALRSVAFALSASLVPCARVMKGMALARGPRPYAAQRTSHAAKAISPRPADPLPNPLETRPPVGIPCGSASSAMLPPRPDERRFDSPDPGSGSDVFDPRRNTRSRSVVSEYAGGAGNRKARPGMSSQPAPWPSFQLFEKSPLGTFARPSGAPGADAGHQEEIGLERKELIRRKNPARCVWAAGESKSDPR